MPSDQVLQALRGSFVRLAEALCLEFTTHLGTAFHLISAKEAGLHQDSRRFSTIVQVTIQSREDVAAASCSQWVVSAGSWVHSMAIGVSVDALRSSQAGLPQSRLLIVQLDSVTTAPRGTCYNPVGLNTGSEVRNR